MAPGEAGGDHAHEHQQLEDGQQSDDQLEGGGDADAENIERHKDHVGAAGDPFRIQRRKLHVEVGPDGHGDGRRGEDEFNQGGKTSDKAAGGPEGAVGIGERAASVRMAVVSSVKLKIKAQYMAAIAVATTINPIVPACDQP